MPCCAASVWKYCRVLSLSPLLEPEFVKPAATLSCQASPNQRFEVASAKTWKAPEAVPMYVGEPKTIASEPSSSSHCASSISSTLIRWTVAPASAAPLRTASAMTAVWP